MSSNLLPCLEAPLENVIVEVRAGEGGLDAKDLVLEQFSIYLKLVERVECL